MVMKMSPHEYTVLWYMSVIIILIQSILCKDPNVAVLKGEDVSSHYTYPGALKECHYWDHRLTMLMSLKDQISSAVVRNILRNLEQTQSSYANAFYALQKDITKVITV